MYDVLLYRNDAVIHSYQKKFNLDPKTAEEHFIEMLKFLYVCSIKTKWSRYSPSPIVDEVWHIFLENTEYKYFCEKHFGRELVHIANVKIPEQYYLDAKKAVFDLFGKNITIWPKLLPNQLRDCVEGE